MMFDQFIEIISGGFSPPLTVSLSVMVLDGWKAEDSERFKTMVQFECRGLEPVDFQPQVRPHNKMVLFWCVVGMIISTEWHV